MEPSIETSGSPKAVQLNIYMDSHLIKGLGKVKTINSCYISRCLGYRRISHRIGIVSDRH
jgi:hypothetical protein